MTHRLEGSRCCLKWKKTGSRPCRQFASRTASSTTSDQVLQAYCNTFLYKLYMHVLYGVRQVLLSGRLEPRHPWRNNS